MPLKLGVPAPFFVAASFENPQFAFNSLGGRFILLGFLPQEAAARAAALALLASLSERYDDEKLVAFAVSREPMNPERRRECAAIRWFFDPDGRVSRQYGAIDPIGAEHAHWVLVDPSLRTFATGGFRDADLLRVLLARLPSPDGHAGVELHAPVLIVPRVFELSLCQRLIAHYESSGGEPSGVMRDIGGRTVGVLDSFKKRRDAPIDDEPFRSDLRDRITHRLLPEILKAFHFRATRLERYIVACYDAEEGGYFRPHRDNTTFGTAHRQFACSINRNAEDYAGGDLRFPEFGSRCYRAPTGGAVVFSCSLLHEATPVTRGRRYAFLPFFYDEEGARIRMENQRRLAEGSEPEPPGEVREPAAG